MSTKEQFNINDLEAAIFDMDGVLVDNMHIHEEVFYQFGLKYGKNVDHEFFVTKVTGSVNEKIMPRIFSDRTLTDQEIQDFAEEKEALYREIYGPQMEPVAGLIEFLELLKAKGVKMAVASNAPEVNVKFVAEKLGLDKYFELYLNGNSVPNPKPAPDMFLKCAKELGADPTKSVVFEDAPGGIRAAKAANMLAVALTTTHTQEELPDADIYVKDFTEFK